jgi:hypothetical protein
MDSEKKQVDTINDFVDAPTAFEVCFLEDELKQKKAMAVLISLNRLHLIDP